MKILYIRNICLSLFILFVVALTQGCKKSAATSTDTSVLPTVVTFSTIIDVTSTTAQSGGVISALGNSIITGDGVCYSSTNAIPTLSDSKVPAVLVTYAFQFPPFTCNLIGLTPNTTYYVRAYGTNAAGTAYGPVVKFTTSSSLTGLTTTVTTFAGNGTAGYVDASGTGAQFNNPEAVTVDSKGNIYVCDTYNALIRKITPGGAVSTFAGSQPSGYNDGPVTTAQFYAPHGSAFDVQGNMYIADQGNNVIRKITPAGIVSTYAGTGTAGYLNGAATSATLNNSSDSLAMFNNPQAVAVDPGGNVYVADRGNNVIRKILTTGRVVTMAGTKTAGYVDATGEGASFNNPSGLVVDNVGNVYVSDQGNAAIRKVTSTGVVSTIAGGSTQTTLLNLPSAIAMDATGDLFIVDEGGRIFEYTSASVLYQLGGTYNLSGFTNGAGTAALFSNPQGIAVDASGTTVYVADQYNNCIRKITITLTN